MSERTESARWWDGAVIYQIYPRSFADSNGDGIGDLAGIRGRLDHLAGTDASLGVDAIWLSPIYPSPQHDFGYDISDYTDVAPEYGTLADADALIAACHERGIRFLMDLVPCHTSIEHPWFVEARSSRHSPKRDWYVWSDPAPDGGVPTNWEAAFGGSTWEWDPETEQYYLHSFYPEQPDLNWRNPAVAEAMADAMRFWFRRGVDGFRVDAIFAAIKDDLLRDNPPDRRPHVIPGLGGNAGQDPLWSMNRPEVHDVIRHLRSIADEFPGRVLVGEAYLPMEELAGYLGHGRDDEFHLAFNFELLLSPCDPRRSTRRTSCRRTPSRTMTNPATRPDGASVAPVPRRSWCSPCAAWRCCTRGRRSGWSTGKRRSCPIHPSTAPDATATAHRCNGTPRRAPASRQASRGCRSSTARRGTSRSSAATRHRSWRSIAG